MNKISKKTYSAADIKILEGLEAVRKRPGMYIGSIGSQGLHHLIWEIIDNSIDEVIEGYANLIEVTITKEKSIIINDNGRGIPIEKHNKTKKSTVETVLTILHAGGKFDNNVYKVSGGLHGVGASVVNALSAWMKVWVYKNYCEYFIEFKNGGKVVDSLKLINENSEISNGTKIEFYPDFTILEENEFDNILIKEKLKQLAFLNKGVRIIFNDYRFDDHNYFYFEGGIKQWIEEINNQKILINQKIVYCEKEELIKIPFKDKKYKISAEIAFQYNNSFNNNIYTFCNNIHTSEGGSHEEGFKFALQKIINKFAIDKKFIKERDEKINKDDVLEGLVAIISIKHPNPQYEGQTKRKLGNSEVRQFISTIVIETFEKYLLENPEEAKAIINKALLAMETRKRTLHIREVVTKKSPFENNFLPGKLADCTTKNNEIAELFVVEGDSAGGSAKLGRERYFQAVLPLKGKVINAEKNSFKRTFANDEINNLVLAIGASFDDKIDLKKIKYNKIILMTDADTDGAHIRILLLTFFFRYMFPIIENGYVYIAQPPLYKVIFDKKQVYVYNDKNLEQIKKNTKFKLEIQRYKGLGEMNPEQLWETTMNPLNRTLIKVCIEDAIKAEHMFSALMGGDVSTRKIFIQQNAKFVKNLDI